MEIETEIPQFFTPKTQTRKVKMLKQDKEEERSILLPNSLNSQFKALRENEVSKCKNSKIKRRFLITSNYLLFIHFLFLDFGIWMGF